MKYSLFPFIRHLLRKIKIMLVSFIIPHKGRKELLEQTIQSILNLDVDLNKIEIIVVTQNKTLTCDHFDFNHTRFKILFRPETDTISTLRNVGEHHAVGEYLAFLDADIQLSPNWLDVMFKELKVKPERVMVSAMQQAAPNGGTTIENIRVMLNSMVADSSVIFLGGANLFIHRNVFQKVGGFPEDLRTCEDYYFTDRVRQYGEVYCSSKASFIHLGEDRNYRELFKKEIWRGQANLLSIRGRKISYREIPSFLTPLWQTFFLFGGVFIALFGKIAIALFCLAMVVLPNILYATRLYKIDRSRVSFRDALWFYSVYLTARATGTITGVIKIMHA